VAKSARAQNAIVTLGTTPQTIRLTGADDGDGSPSTDVGTGWGLMIMRERAAAVVAELSLGSTPGHGTNVTAGLKDDDQ
jgi:nitrate/nitrite-specific signal transduction histidine kinase